MICKNCHELIELAPKFIQEHEETAAYIWEKEVCLRCMPGSFRKNAAENFQEDKRVYNRTINYRRIER